MADSLHASAGASTGTTFITQGRDEKGDAHQYGELDTNENVSQHTRILRKEEEEKIMNQKLKGMKEEYATRMKLVKQNEEAFLSLQRARIRQLRKAKEQIVETDTKRARAEAKATEETTLALKKAAEKAQLIQQLADAELRVKKDQKKLDRYKEYQSYLASVHEQFKLDSIAEILDRHKVLEKTNQDLERSHKAVEEEIQKLTTAYQQSKKLAENDTLLKQSLLAELQKHLEDCTDTVARLEEEVQRQEKESKETNRTFGEVQSAIENLSALIEHWTEDKEMAQQSGATTIQQTSAQKKQHQLLMAQQAAAAAAAAASSQTTTQSRKWKKNDPLNTGAAGGNSIAAAAAAALAARSAAGGDAGTATAAAGTVSLQLSTEQALAERRRQDEKTKQQLMLMLADIQEKFDDIYSVLRAVAFKLNDEILKSAPNAIRSARPNEDLEPILIRCDSYLKLSVSVREQLRFDTRSSKLVSSLRDAEEQCRLRIDELLEERERDERVRNEAARKTPSSRGQAGAGAGGAGAAGAGNMQNRDANSPSSSAASQAPNWGLTSARGRNESRLGMALSQSQRGGGGGGGGGSGGVDGMQSRAAHILDHIKQFQVADAPPPTDYHRQLSSALGQHAPAPLTLGTSDSRASLSGYGGGGGGGGGSLLAGGNSGSRVNSSRRQTGTNGMPPRNSSSGSKSTLVTPKAGAVPSYGQE